jgi:hypothetical protein
MRELRAVTVVATKPPRPCTFNPAPRQTPNAILLNPDLYTQALREAVKLCEQKLSEQGIVLAASRERCEGLQGVIDTMVPRTELLAARADAKAARDEVESTKRAAALFEVMSNDLREQLASERENCERLSAAIAEMAPRSELNAARKDAKEYKDK